MSEETPETESKESAPKETENQPTVESTDVEAFIAELESANISNPEQLKGHLTNAREYHKIQSERDTLASELKAMSDKMDELTRMQQQPKDSWEDEPTQTPPVDLEGSFIKALQKYDTMKSQEQMKLQQQQLEAYDAITNDPSYGAVKDIWEQQLKDPRFLAEINSGRKHPVDAYKDLVIENQKQMLLKASDTLKALHGNKPVVTPRVEQGGSKGGVAPEEDRNDTAELFKNVKADVDKGRTLTQDEELALLERMLSGK